MHKVINSIYKSFWKSFRSCTDGNSTWKKYLHCSIIAILELLNNFFKTRLTVKAKILRFYVKFLTDKQTDKRRVLHNLFGGCNKTKQYKQTIIVHW